MGVDRRSLTEAVRARALGLGFDAVGFAEAGPADPDGRLLAWLARGFGGEMDYMAATVAARRDPAVHVPEVRSVVALSISYWRPEAEPQEPLKVARYAQGDDYHRVLKKKLRKLRNTIMALVPGAVVHPAVDTSPILEREWAQRAGIAWIGKSTMAINESLGTYTFLASLLTSVQFEYGTPLPDRCGTCTACLDACPTGAFVAPYQLDARRCISYWTLEHPGPLPQDADLHGWVAGCDVCQEVCPWNKFARVSQEKRFSPRETFARPDPEVFADPERLAAPLAGSALLHAGPERMRRNTLRILNACQDPQKR